jgi:hypothetical protein
MSSENVFPFERRAAPTLPKDFEPAQALRRCRALMDTLGHYDLPDETSEACVLMLLVNLNDLLQAAKSAGHPLTFSEHIEPDAEVSDISELITRCRNAACHVWGRSGQSFHAFRFYRVVGYCARANVFDGKTLGCEFHDDIAIYYGKCRMYLKRHAARALEVLGEIFPDKH